jgi:hypothetical protein
MKEIIGGLPGLFEKLPAKLIRAYIFIDNRFPEPEPIPRVHGFPIRIRGFCQGI